MRIVGWLIALVVVVGVVGGEVAAQSTGGSIGGGDWSGGGGGDWSGGGGGDYSGGGGSDYSSSGGGDYSSGGSLAGASDAVVLVVIAIVLVGGMIASAVKEARGDFSLASATVGGGHAYAPVADVDVTLLRFALDARVRPYVQKELDRIARTADTSTQAGLLTTLHEVALMLRRIHDAWVYGGATNHAMTATAFAQSTFRQAVAKARETFRHELVRNADGVVTTSDAPDRAPRGDEGAGLVLVTLVVAARQELFTVRKVADGQDLRRALEVLSGLTAHTLVAVEIIWTPAAPDDRMSSIELETILKGEIFPITGAMVGKVVCSYCSGPFPAELISCPHCGAPARDARAAG